MPSSSIKAITRKSETLMDLFIYINDLSPLDMDLLLTLIAHNNKQMTLEDLSKAVNRDKSTVFRSLQKLTGLGICVKESRTLKEGGHFHVYSAISREIFKLETEKRVKELEQSLRRILKKFEDDLEVMLDDVFDTKKKIIK